MRDASPAKFLLRDQENAAVFSGVSLLSTARKRAALIALSFAAGILILAKIGESTGLRINLTPSLPVGLWLLQQPQGAIQRGAIVAFCPPPTISRLGCGREGEQGVVFLKPVIAVAGDEVTVGEDSLTINGRRISNTARLQSPNIPAIPPGLYIVEEGQFWALSNTHPRSFDSRYFGPVTETSIQGVAKSLLVWP